MTNQEQHQDGTNPNEQRRSSNIFDLPEHNPFRIEENNPVYQRFLKANMNLAISREEHGAPTPEALKEYYDAITAVNSEVISLVSGDRTVT